MTASVGMDSTLKDMDKKLSVFLDRITVGHLGELFYGKSSSLVKSFRENPLPTWFLGMLINDQMRAEKDLVLKMIDLLALHKSQEAVDKMWDVWPDDVIDVIGTTEDQWAIKMRKEEASMKMGLCPSAVACRKGVENMKPLVSLGVLGNDGGRSVILNVKEWEKRLALGFGGQMFLAQRAIGIFLNFLEREPANAHILLPQKYSLIFRVPKGDETLFAVGQMSISNDCDLVGGIERNISSVLDIIVEFGEMRVRECVLRGDGERGKENDMVVNVLELLEIKKVRDDLVLGLQTNTSGGQCAGRTKKV